MLIFRVPLSSPDSRDDPDYQLFLEADAMWARTGVFKGVSSWTIGVLNDESEYEWSYWASVSPEAELWLLMHMPPSADRYDPQNPFPLPYYIQRLL